MNQCSQRVGMDFMLTLWDLTLVGIPEDQMDWERERTWCLITQMTALQASGFRAEEALMAGYLRWGKDGHSIYIPPHYWAIINLFHAPLHKTHRTHEVWKCWHRGSNAIYYLNTIEIQEHCIRKGHGRVCNNLGRVCVYLSSLTPSSVSHGRLNILLC